MTIRTHTRCMVFILLLSLLSGCFDAPAAEALISQQESTWGLVFGQPPNTAAVVSEAPNASAAEAATMELDGLDESLTDALISSGAIRQAMEDYDIPQDSSAFEALKRVNSVYAETLSEDQKARLLVFLFEGAGENTDPQERKDAMCVVVQNGEILYLSRCCSTIPDYPFSPWKNDGDDVPTLKSGIYSFDTVNHNGRYAALRVLGDQVVRFHDNDEFYSDVSNNQSIQVHRRGHEENSPDDEVWANSIGCLLVGHAGTDPDDDYATFAHAVGILKEGSSGSTPYEAQSYGTLIVDRSLGADYLRAIGYPDEAIAALEGN